MDKELMCQELPKEAPAEVLRYTLEMHLDDLGGQMTLFKRVSATLAPRLMDLLITPEMAEEYETKKRNAWVAECDCTVCGGQYHTDWVTERGHKGIGIVEGEDGLTYPCLDDYDPGTGTYIQITSGDGFLCPFCASVTTLKRKGSMRGGRTWRLLISGVENVGIYTTIFYWLVWRTIDEDGCVYHGIDPWQAYGIDEGGFLHRFIFNRHTKTWRYSSTKGDAFFSKYPSMDGGMYNNRCAGWAYETCPSLIGCTGEKTGLHAYVSAGGQTPVLYVQTWRRHKTVENLVNNGWVALVEGYIEQETENRCKEIPYARMPGIYFGGKRPHAMLRMDKLSFRRLRERYPNGWSLTQYEAWIKYVEAGGGADALMFDDYYKIFTLQGVNVLIDLRTINAEIDFLKLHSYLTKQKLRPEEAQLLLDTWSMTMRMFGRTELTSEELWPRDLFAAHERISRQYRLEKNKDEWTKFLAGFAAVRRRLHELEWTDGELCIVLPKDNGDLIQEGDVLRHCVSSYGENHVSGQDTIFFVRKYRRPERSYYTLDIDMREKPTRKQLHGYGNERHGSNKEHRHTIPAKVSAFVDRWEREILMPWYHEQQRKKMVQEANTIRKEAKSA